MRSTNRPLRCYIGQIAGPKKETKRASSRSPNEFKTLKMAVMSILFLPPNLSVHILRAPPQFVAYATREVVKDLKYCLHYHFKWYVAETYHFVVCQNE